jgi:hypothetical protein
VKFFGLSEISDFEENFFSRQRNAPERGRVGAWVGPRGGLWCGGVPGGCVTALAKHGAAQGGSRSHAGGGEAGRWEGGLEARSREARFGAS